MILAINNVHTLKFIFYKILKDITLFFFYIILNMMANKKHLTKSGFLKLASYLTLKNKLNLNL